MTQTYLAQLNIAKPVAPLDSIALQDFTNNVDYINGLAEGAAGFVWRRVSELGDPLEAELFGDNTIANLSVWQSRDALQDFVYQGEHLAFLRRKCEWFESMVEAHMVLWWQPAVAMPSLQEAHKRLLCFREQGPNPQAFTFKRCFPQPEVAATRFTQGDSSFLVS